MVLNILNAAFETALALRLQSHLLCTETENKKGASETTQRNCSLESSFVDS